MARRILLTIEYDGTAYSGWQRQYNGLAVQQLIEEALCRATGETITITGASRTDAGVHALGQCAHFDTASRIPSAMASTPGPTRMPSSSSASLRRSRSEPSISSAISGSL